MATIPCSLALKQCLPCNDDPVANISAEAPDVDVFIGFRDFNWNPPLGNTYFQLGCKTICFSTVSQEDADLCALRQAQSCVWTGGKPPVTPPIPPGPNSPGGKGQPPNTPGGVPPRFPRNPIRTYFNIVQTCDAICPDGSPFTEFVAAGTIGELSQALADAKAYSLACIRAQANLFCISDEQPPGACVGDGYFFRLNTSGGVDLLWSIDAGVLPPGLSLDPINGTITGTAGGSGSFSFLVVVTDSLGRGQSKSFTICVMEIVTGSVLPEAPVGDVYAQPLIQEPATVSSEVWTLVSGSLPPGITLASNGALNGTPTEEGTSDFTIRVDAVCDGVAVSCQKAFTLEVVSGVDCMGEAQTIGAAIWNQISLPGNGTITIVAGDGTFMGVAAVDPNAEAMALICNASLVPYDFTVEINWTTTGGFHPLGGSQALVRLNGVTTVSPVEHTNGSFTFNFAGQLQSGVNDVRIACSFNSVFAGTLNGDCAIRPLNPP
jgi:hypothetical protein